MAAFMQQQMDYIFLCYGLAFILLAAICFTKRREQGQRLPWTWLGLFGLIHGIHEWLEMLTFSLGDPKIFSAVRLGLMILSFAFLLEFGRTSWRKLGGKSPGPWVHLPLLACAVAAWPAGMSGMNAATRYAFALTGGFWSAAALWRASRLEKDSRRILILSSLTMAGYTLTAGAVVPPAPFFPASTVNYSAFLALTGIPIQLIRGILAACLTATIWQYHQESRQGYLPEAERPTKRYQGASLAVVIIGVLAMGWVFTWLAGKYADRRVRNDILNQTRMVTLSLDRERAAKLTGTPADLHLPEYRYLREQLMHMHMVKPQLRWIYLLFQREDGFHLAMDSVPEGNPDHNDPGVYYQRPPRELFAVFASGESATVGPYTDEWGSFISGLAALRDPSSGRIIGVLGIDIDAAVWQRSVAYFRLGGIFITVQFALIFIAIFVVLQRQSELALKISASEQRLKKAQEVAQVGSWTYDPKSDRVTWSAEMFHICGLDPAAIPSLDGYRKLMHPKDLPRLDAAVQAAITEGRGYDLEFQLLRPDGTVRHILSRAEVKRGSHGQILQLVGTSQDITERKQAEMELRKLSTAVEQSPTAIVITDRDGNIEYVNPKFTRLTGYAIDEVLGKNPRILKSGDKPREEYKRLWDTILSGHEWEGEFHNQKKNGDLFWEHAVIAPLMNADGMATHFVAVKENITERKQAEQALRESRRELSTLLSNLPGMAYRRRDDPLWTINFISQGCRAITGYSPEELIGNARVSFSDLIHPDDRETVRQDVQDSLKAQQPFQLVYRLITAERKTKWIWEQGQGIYREDGTLASIEGFMADITERRQMEEALKKAHAELEEKNHELGIKNREMEKERVLAYKVLESVLPQDLRLPGLRTAVCYRPSRLIGGDFFDAWVLNDQAHFLIGDISGHSISAALMMAVCKGMFQSLGHTLGDPLEIVTTANRMLCPMMSDSQMFLTLVYAVLDLKTSIVWLVSAGHNPIYLLDGTATTTIESTGPALGWDTEDRWETVEHRLLPGAMLFLYTDGLVEARDARGQEFGSILPEKFLGHRSPRELTAAVVAELERFHPGELEDDMTILAIGRECDEGQTRLGLSFKPCFDRVDDIRTAVREASADHLRLPESDPNITDFCQAVTELMNNAVEHSGAKSIKADLHFSGRETAFTLTTDGLPFDPTGKAELPEPDASGDWPQGGYGLGIIQRLVDGIEHEYRDGYNRVTLKKTIPTAKGEGAGDGNQA